MRDEDFGERFLLNTGRLIPPWFVAVWYLFVGLIAAAGTIGLAVQLNPFALFFPVFGATMIGFVHVSMRGLRNPDENFAELTDDKLRVRVWRPRLAWFKPFARDFSYSTVVDVKGVVRHGFPWGVMGAWPYAVAWGLKWQHVDVELRSARFMSPAWGGYPFWYRVLHLDVMEPERFVEALVKRIKDSGVSEPHSS